MESLLVSRESCSVPPYLLINLAEKRVVFSVVYSTEVPGEVKLLPLPEEEFQKGSVKELSAFDDFRVRILPVLGASIRVIPVTLHKKLSLVLCRRPTSRHLRTPHRDLHPARRGRQTSPRRRGNQEPEKSIPISRARSIRARTTVPKARTARTITHHLR